MASNGPTDQDGNPLGVVVKSAARAPQRRLLDVGFAAAVREVIRKERAARTQLQAELEGLRAEIEALRSEFAVCRRLDDLQQRIDRIEGSAPPRAGLRVA